MRQVQQRALRDDPRRQALMLQQAHSRGHLPQFRANVGGLQVDPVGEGGERVGGVPRRGGQAEQVEAAGVERFQSFQQIVMTLLCHRQRVPVSRRRQLPFVREEFQKVLLSLAQVVEQVAKLLFDHRYRLSSSGGKE